MIKIGTIGKDQTVYQDGEDAIIQNTDGKEVRMSMALLYKWVVFDPVES